MNKNIVLLFFLLLLTGCSVIEDIFAVGFWAGIIVVLIVLALIIGIGIWIFKKFF